MRMEERIVCYKLLMGYEDEEAIKEKILAIPSKWLSKEANLLISEYKKMKLNGLTLSYLEKIKDLEDILPEVTDLPDQFIFLEQTEQAINVLAYSYYQDRARAIAGDRLELIKPNVIKLYEEVVNTVDNSTKESSMEDLERLLEEGMEEKNYIKTGSFRFDKVLRFTRRDLHVIGARPAVGKSAFALYVALQMADYGKGLFFSLEMPETQIAQRIVASESGVLLDVLMGVSKKSLDSVEKEKVKVALEKLKKKHLKIIDGNFSIHKLRDRVRKEKELYGLDFIFVDYLQLLKSDLKNRYEAITEVSMTLKQIAKEFDITVIALSQLSREIEKRQGDTIYLSDFRESGQIEQDATIVLGLSGRDTENGASELDVQILKQRMGILGMLPYSYYKPNQKIYEREAR